MMRRVTSLLIALAVSSPVGALAQQRGDRLSSACRGAAGASVRRWRTTRHPPPAMPLPPFIPPVTDADRAGGVSRRARPCRARRRRQLLRAVRSARVAGGGGARGLSWDTKGWIGRDRDRLWFRTEGESASGPARRAAQAHVLYGRAIARWWDVVGGHPAGRAPRPAQTWAGRRHPGPGAVLVRGRGHGLRRRLRPHARSGSRPNTSCC